jgi:pyruvate formate lyase activating enzyme
MEYGKMKKALLFNTDDSGIVHCLLCAHRCRIYPDKSGFCEVRTNDNGTLYTHAYGNIISSAVDPVEKKPLYHFHPGSKTFSIAIPGCNFRCGFCQNWEISQINKFNQSQRKERFVQPEEIIESAKKTHCKSISFTYTEPVIFMEYALETARLAKEAGLYTVFVSNGYMTAEALELIAPYLDACNIDLKAFTETFYKNNCKAHLQPVLDSIERLNNNGIHVEVTTLIIPGENDSEQELNDIAGFLSSVNPDIPWHVSRFFPRYEFLNHTITPAETVQGAVNIGLHKGLHYVYGGNLSETDSSTKCYKCQHTIVERSGYTSGQPQTKNGRCPSCGVHIYGNWQ